MRLALATLLSLSALLAGCTNDPTPGSSSSDDGGGGDGGGAGDAAVTPDACSAATVLCGASCVDTTSDALHCGGCDHACAANEACTASTCVAAGPSLVQDNFAPQPGGTRTFQAVVRFSEPVVGVDATSVQVDGDARIDGVQTTDQQTYTFAVALLRNATTYTVSFGAAIHDAHNAALVPVTRTLPVGGHVYYVVAGGRGTKDGLSPANAMAEVYMATQAASKDPGSDVWVAAGTFTEIDLWGGNSVYGGFDDTFTTRDIMKQRTHLTGDTIVFFDSTTTEDSVIDGVSLEGSHSSNGNAWTVYVKPVKSRLVLTRDYVFSGGGGYESYAIYAQGGNVLADACYITSSGSTAPVGLSGGGALTNDVIEAPIGVTAYTTTVLANDTFLTTWECVDVRSDVTAADNVFVGSGGGTCIDGTVGAMSIDRLENNAFWAFATMYAGPTSQSGINAPSLLNSASALGAQTAGGNVVANPVLGGLGVPTASTPASILSGGRDTSSASYGNVTRDYDGKPRAIPYAMGAYEP